jgi:archaellum biogenesis protein FlaJ (TadC family)
VSQQERKARLRRLASQLAVEAMQVGAQADLVMEVVGEEIGKLHDLRAKAARRQPPKKQPTPQR